MAAAAALVELVRRNMGITLVYQQECVTSRHCHHYWPKPQAQATTLAGIMLYQLTVVVAVVVVPAVEPASTSASAEPQSFLPTTSSQLTLFPAFFFLWLDWIHSLVTQSGTSSGKNQRCLVLVVPNWQIHWQL